MVEDLLLEIGAAVDRVHDLERARLALMALAEAVGQPAPEGAGLLGEPEPEERIDGERCVADPGEAVVPVALAAELLGEARGRCGDERAGRLVRQELQRQRRTPHDLAPPSLVARRGDPPQPVVDRLVQELARVVLGVRSRLLALLEDERRALPLIEEEGCAHAFLRAFERDVGRERQREIG